MGETIAWVTRSSESSYIANPAVQPKVMLGPFPSAGAAQRAVEGQRALRWTRTVFDPRGEVYRGDDPGFWPGDFQDAVALWLRSDRGVITASSATPVRRWNSIDGAGGSLGAAAASGAEPELVRHVAGNKPAVRFAVGDLLTTTFASLAPPFSVAIAAKYTAAAGLPAERRALDSTLFNVHVRAADSHWRVLSNTATLDVGAATGGVDVVVVNVDATLGTTAYLNGAASATDPDFPAGAIGAITLGSGGGDFTGDIYEVVVLSRTLRLVPRTRTEVTLLTNYLRRRYS